jgi:hypothetical protein
MIVTRLLLSIAVGIWCVFLGAAAFVLAELVLMRWSL